MIPAILSGTLVQARAALAQGRKPQVLGASDWACRVASGQPRSRPSEELHARGRRRGPATCLGRTLPMPRRRRASNQ